MTTALPKPKQMQRKNALAQLEVEELRAGLAQMRAELDASSEQASLEHLRALVDLFAATTERISEALEAPVGVTVDQAAAKLRVTPPTVRKWVGEGLLRALEGRKPVEIEPRSVVEVERILLQVRDSYPSRKWTEALAAYLHDQHVQGDESFQRAAEQARRGDLVEI
ncbi:DNA-binding protein [Conexibacter woesei]|uniref:DNA-binding protein n=1 Tax=Conexibacter woesei TaxID=191495 RepID=UPI000427E1B3|nr:DNA-binding protein [Conexibacter woesei]